MAFRVGETVVIRTVSGRDGKTLRTRASQVTKVEKKRVHVLGTLLRFKTDGSAFQTGAAHLQMDDRVSIAKP